MSFMLSNYGNAPMPDLTDPDINSGAQISDSSNANCLARLVNDHTHDGVGRGARIPMSNLEAATLPMASNAITGVTTITFVAVSSTASIPNGSLGVVGNDLYFRTPAGVLVGPLS